MQQRLDEEERPILAMGRCAASIASLPLIARKHPDAVVVWFDAHGDCNVPVDGCVSDMNYLGGMVITGAAGEWDTGFGSGLSLDNVILVGSRDLDPPEVQRIEGGQIKLVSVGAGLGSRLKDAIAGRDVYVHLDCDVLTAGLIATEYQSPEGLSYSDLRDAFSILAQHHVLGLEITEYEGIWPNGEDCSPEQLIEAIHPVVEKVT